MKSKEEMIEVISEQDAVINACRAYDSRCGTVDEIVDEVITALCGALPDVPKQEWQIGKGAVVTDYGELLDIYNQLKQWGNE
jgi:hypothetical protein